jgi:VanZ family protein
MQSMMRLVSLAYLALLTTLLLVKDPLWFLASRGNVEPFFRFLMPISHLLGFFGLAILCLLARWPVPRWVIVALLAFYGGMTEVAQSCLPPRTAEMIDWIQDLTGIALGAACCWFTATIFNTWVKSMRVGSEVVVPAATNESEAARNVFSRSANQCGSWWG